MGEFGYGLEYYSSTPSISLNTYPLRYSPRVGLESSRVVPRLSNADESTLLRPI